MRFGGTKNHLISGMAMTVGIFAALVMSMVVPQSALSQFASPSGTNQSQLAEINIPPNDSAEEPVPKLIVGPGGLVIHDPGGDDVFTKDCKYKGLAYSTGATVTMPKPGGGTQVKVCGYDGNWLANE